VPYMQRLRQDSQNHEETNTKYAWVHLSCTNWLARHDSEVINDGLV